MNFSKKMLSLVFVLVGIALAPNASATLIDRGAYFTDTRIGMDWLKLGATAGQTFTSVANGFDGYVSTGWDFASPAQLIELYVSAGAPNDGFPQIAKPEYAAPARMLIDLFGVTVQGQGNYGWSSGMTNLAAASGQHYITIIQDNGNGTGYLSPTWRAQSDFAPIWGGGGAFLIRSTAQASNVPEPESILLVGIGALGIATARRRQLSSYCKR